MPPISLPTATATTAAALSLLLRRAAAQPSPPAAAQSSSPAATVVIILIAILFVVTGFLSVFLRHLVAACLGRDHGPLGLGSYGPGLARGLDPGLVKTFPTFLYSDVEIHRQTQTALECAVCLSEFETTDLLRLLPPCNHVFHTHCIDPWLASRVTCPICRANLEPRGPARAQPPSSARNVDDEDRDLILNIRKSPEVRDRAGTVKFARSHSTGHSLVQPGEDLERFTLRLPEPVRSGLVSLNLPGLVSPRWVFDRAMGHEGSAGDKPGSNRGEGSNNSRWGWFSMTPSFVNGRSPSPPPPDNQATRPDTGERSFDRLWAGQAV